MKIAMRFEGGEELARALNALPMALSRRVVLQALTEGAEPIRAKAERLAPWNREPHPYGHLAQHIIVGTANRLGSVAGGRWERRDEDEHAVAVGPRKDFFYGIFQEYGTRFHGAQPFMRPAFDGETPKALGLIGQALWKALAKAAPTSLQVAA